MLKKNELEKTIKCYADFPKPGIIYRDISPILADPKIFKSVIRKLFNAICEWEPEMLVAIDSRGFLFATPLAIRLGIGVIMIRKKGKLPGNVLQKSYSLEYGVSILEMQKEAQTKNRRIVIIDDLLATGGTLSAAESLLMNNGALLIGNLVIIELMNLKGRKRLQAPTKSLQAYDY